VKRKFRITRSIDFKRVRRQGKSYAHPLFVLVSFRNENTRVGFITGKKIGNAVTRNRKKRQLRAIFSDFLPYFLKQSEIIVIAREPVQRASFDEMRNAIKQLLIKAELIDLEEYDPGRSTN
jgi:ribonuclease P protein component